MIPKQVSYAIISIQEHFERYFLSVFTFSSFLQLQRDGAPAQGPEGYQILLYRLTDRHGSLQDVIQEHHERAFFSMIVTLA